jgi:hypothetical protein
MNSLCPAEWPQSRRFDRRHRRFLRYAERALDLDWLLFGDWLITVGPVRTPRSRRVQDREREWQYQPQLLEGLDPRSDAPDAALAATALQFADDGLDKQDRYQWESYGHRGLRRLLGPSHPETLRPARSLAITCLPVDRADEAIALHREIVEQHARYGRRAAAEQARLELSMQLHNIGAYRPATNLTRRAGRLSNGCWAL